MRYITTLLTAVLLILSSNALAQEKPQDQVQADLPPRGGAIPIPDDGYDGTLGSMACATVNVAETGPVDDVDVTLNAEHTWVGDLTVKLVSPSGTVNTLMSRPGLAEPADDGTDCCGNSDNLELATPVNFSTTNGVVDAETMGGTDTDNVVCADDGECDFIPNPDTGPGGPLDTFFDGEEASGDWQVCVGDSAGLDTGNLSDNGNNVSVTLAQQTPDVPAVPTLSQIGLILLALALGVGGVAALRRHG